MSNIVLTHLENAKANIKAEEQRQISIIRERVLREIQPKYTEIEQMKNETLNKLSLDYNESRKLASDQYNAQLIALQNKFESDNQEIVENTEKKKSEMLNSALATETYEITKECEKAICKLDAQIKEIKE